MALCHYVSCVIVKKESSAFIILMPDCDPESFMKHI